jgi:quercetin dioxygenase-like cupin family protein
MMNFRPIAIATALVLTASGLAAQESSSPQSPVTAAVNAAPPEVAPDPRPGNPATIFPWAEMDFAPTGTGERVQLMDEPSRTLGVMEIHITTLNPGQTSHAPHRHANEEVIVLYRGTLDVYVNGEVKRIGPGSVMVFLSNDWHSVNNVGDEAATYHVFNFHPDPQD